MRFVACIYWFFLAFSGIFLLPEKDVISGSAAERELHVHSSYVRSSPILSSCRSYKETLTGSGYGLAGQQIKTVRPKRKFIEHSPCCIYLGNDELIRNTYCRLHFPITVDFLLRRRTAENLIRAPPCPGIS
jgi:hypothetical protein